MDAKTAPMGIKEALMEATQDMPVFERLGFIVRALHDTLREVGAESVLLEAAQDFPPARNRLLHIAELTERSANVVLTNVENHMPIQEKLSKQAGELAQAWIVADADPVALRAQTVAFLHATRDGATATHQALSDIMMAQDFQDLTGQLIKKVVALIERTETEMLRLLVDAIPPGHVIHEKKEEVMAGPGAAGSIALGQDAVDDLLADLGFYGPPGLSPSSPCRHADLANDSSRPPAAGPRAARAARPFCPRRHAVFRRTAGRHHGHAGTRPPGHAARRCRARAYPGCGSGKPRLSHPGLGRQYPRCPDAPAQ